MEAIDESQRIQTVTRTICDWLITLVLWAYFTLGFIIFFSPFYIITGLFAHKRARGFQKLNCRFYRGLIFLVRALMPEHHWSISPAVTSIRASVIVSNHLSYLDPLLLISLFERHTTIVKGRLFHIPVFGWMLTQSGYIPSAATGRLADIMLRQMEALPEILASGGNIFIFPEGTRSRDGRVGTFHPGAFKIARNCGAPIEVVRIANTDRMFQPGRFLFRSKGPNRISVEKVGRFDPPNGHHTDTLQATMDAVKERLSETRQSPRSQPKGEA